jgi:hypothetical protein
MARKIVFARFSVVNCTIGRVSSPGRRRRQLVEFCCVSMSRMRTVRPLAAAAARLREIKGVCQQADHPASDERDV